MGKKTIPTEKNGPTAAELYAALAGAAPDTAFEAAWLYLTTGKGPAGRLRLVDPETGAHLLRFEANGTRYQVRTAEEGVGLLRFQRLQVLTAQMGMDADLNSQYAALSAIEANFNKAQYVQAAHGIVDMKMAISRAQRPFPYAAEACAMFIVKEGEDDTELPSAADIEAKVEDWNAAGLHEADFFFLALRYTQGWSSALHAFSLKLQGNLG
jgi:hypothetical protein